VKRLLLVAVAAGVFVVIPGTVALPLLAIVVDRLSLRNRVQVIRPWALEVRTPRLTITVCR
jgi:hypothetical protein